MKTGAGSLFSGIGKLGVLLTGYALFAIIAWEIGIQSAWVNLPTVFAFYFLGHLFQALAMAYKEAASKSVFMVLKLFFLLAALSLYDLLTILLILPIIVIGLVSGPLMFLVFFVTSAGLLIYAWESLIGDIKGCSSFENIKQAATALGLWFTSVIVIYFRLSEHGDFFEEKGIDLIVCLREYLHKCADKIMKKQSQ